MSLDRDVVVVRARVHDRSQNYDENATSATNTRCCRVQHHPVGQWSGEVSGPPMPAAGTVAAPSMGSVAEGAGNEPDPLITKAPIAMVSGPSHAKGVRAVCGEWIGPPFVAACDCFARWQVDAVQGELVSPTDRPGRHRRRLAGFTSTPTAMGLRASGL